MNSIEDPALSYECDLTAERDRLLRHVADLEARLAACERDAERLDALEELVNNGDCPGIINDDNGHWAVTGSGMQNVVCGDVPQDVQTTFFVEAADWRDTIREAIDAYLDAARSET